MEIKNEKTFNFADSKGRVSVEVKVFQKLSSAQSFKDNWLWKIEIAAKFDGEDVQAELGGTVYEPTILLPIGHKVGMKDNTAIFKQPQMVEIFDWQRACDKKRREQISEISNEPTWEDTHNL